MTGWIFGKTVDVRIVLNQSCGIRKDTFFVILYPDSVAKSLRNPSGVKMCDDPMITSQFFKALVTSYAARISEKHTPPTMKTIRRGTFFTVCWPLSLCQWP